MPQSELEEHLRTECKGVAVTCKECSMSLTREAFVKHGCYVKLKEIMDEFKEGKLIQMSNYLLKYRNVNGEFDALQNNQSIPK